MIAPILAWLLHRKGASHTSILLITLGVLAGFIFQLTTIVLTAVPRLHGRITRLQIIDLAGALLRLIFAGSLATAALLGSITAVWTNAAAFLIVNCLLRS